MHKWLNERLFSAECVGFDVKLWRTIANDPRMSEVWRIINKWPEPAAQGLIDFAAMQVARQDVISVVADDAASQRIADTAHALATELRSHPRKAKDFLDAEPEPFLDRLNALVDRASQDALHHQELFPSVSSRSRRDRNQMRFREALANWFDRARLRGSFVATRDQQHKLVAELTNVLFDIDDEHLVTADAEMQRWKGRRKRQRQAV